MVELQQIKTGFEANEFFLMANDDPSGRPRLSERILALGLAGALLCELVLDNAVAIEKGNLVRTAHHRPRHLLHVRLCGEVDEEAPRSVRDWLDYLGLQAIDRVGQRLRNAGVVQFQQPRLKMPGRTGRWLPVDVQTANWPAVDVARKVYYGRATASDLVLFGLTRATGLDNPALWEIRHLLTDPTLLKQTLSPLAVYNSALVDLLTQTEVAVASAVASQRRG
ncbi:GPP34 family phosphoprotein [Catenulispora sp. NF23]|uniref:GPP34 family phosphoprotein n=1 Tax=Catenulispora pinistramenti TaxID=2705254 RepID=A0ABS5KIK5_9ACTN|nr:GPP34 family phosphoprotein [Catenulispora pinistramenti]MBS2531601.1 GPP34 family phosphoprotein [Catenulispora pinistramenti]MBS2546149.1 GPP34 family phosphoprotein [Catenulispora pinistramenti]